MIIQRCWNCTRGQSAASITKYFRGNLTLGPHFTVWWNTLYSEATAIYNSRSCNFKWPCFVVHCKEVWKILPAACNFHVIFTRLFDAILVAGSNGIVKLVLSRLRSRHGSRWIQVFDRHILLWVSTLSQQAGWLLWFKKKGGGKIVIHA